MNVDMWEEVGFPYPTPSLFLFRIGGKYVNHIALHIGDNNFIHTSSQAGVAISNVFDSMWRKRFVGAYVVKRGNHGDDKNCT